MSHDEACCNFFNLQSAFYFGQHTNFDVFIKRTSQNSNRHGKCKEHHYVVCDLQTLCSILFAEEDFSANGNVSAISINSALLKKCAN